MNRRGFLRALGLTAVAIPAAKVVGGVSELVKQAKDNIEIAKANGLYGNKVSGSMRADRPDPKDLIYRDDLSDIIYDISPQSTPFLSTVSTKHGWE